jgi:transketolase N-terminal domain/subunit|tara:strand:+ start:200 stop:400 length:201 start_codon:yes stop_codon:yes gene_type:complete
MSADKRLYEVKVNVMEERIYHIYADDERDLGEIWENNKFKDKKPIDTSTVWRDKRNYTMIKNKENL